MNKDKKKDIQPNLQGEQDPQNNNKHPQQESIKPMEISPSSDSAEKEGTHKKAATDVEREGIAHPHEYKTPVSKNPKEGTESSEKTQSSTDANSDTSTHRSATI